MFTIPSAACLAGLCNVFFGVVDWSDIQNLNGSCFAFNDGRAICVNGISYAKSEESKARAQLRKIIGNKTVACAVKFVPTPFGSHAYGECYFENGVSVADEMHKRGF